MYSRPPEESFDEFVINVLFWELGERWFKAQRALPPDQRHFIMRCWDGYHRFKDRSMTEANRRGKHWAAPPDGWTKSLLALAIDVYSLLHRGELPRRLANRLLNADQYQGARYEIAIAGLFTRIGCKVAFLDRSTSDPQATHCEFIATHIASGVEVGVEVKSRHRRGVQGRPGTPADVAAVRGDIAPVVDDALTQAPDGKPFIVFVDANAPMDVATGEPRPWVEDIEGYLTGLPRGTSGAPVRWNAIVVTNYAFHYATEDEAEPAQFGAISAAYPLVPLPSVEFYKNLRIGLGRYGTTPPLA
jgi:hypothetical protein